MFYLVFTAAGSRSEVLDPTEMFICFSFGQYQAAVILEMEKKNKSTY